MRCCANWRIRAPKRGALWKRRRYPQLRLHAQTLSNLLTAMSRLLEGDDTRLPRVDDTFTQKTVNDARKRKWRMPQRKQTKRSGHPAGEELLDEMVWEILIRLPVESLARIKLVSKLKMKILLSMSLVGNALLSSARVCNEY
ncbi:uncharacterized protein [Triticum aestivum]|uniref:uncharacterized protein isoform X2 n=1 Tax=Triticum aestivum TaxID=4565 RepID=UPI001D032292|nr:uncharacterized protein LOC123069623 isoform X2 [Triticum aestivum]